MWCGTGFQPVSLVARGFDSPTAEPAAHAVFSICVNLRNLWMHSLSPVGGFDSPPLKRWGTRFLQPALDGEP
jgi:hypothetical protein